MNKEDLRKKMLAKRFAMTKAQIQHKSQQICERLLADPIWSTVASVHIYKSRTDWHEVDTAELIKQIKINWSRLAIAQPGNKHNEKVPTEKFDLIIVPTLTFDKHGNRLGWGGGWYDKFLVTQPQAYKVGLCFQNGQLGSIPAEAHDISLDKIITEQSVVEVK